MQAELFFAVESPQAGSCLMIEQAGGGDQLSAVQVAHADVAAIRVVVVDVQALLGPLESGAELATEHGITQGLGFTQCCRADQAFGVQATGDGLGSQGHRLASVIQPAMVAAGRCCWASSG